MALNDAYEDDDSLDGEVVATNDTATEPVTTTSNTNQDWLRSQFTKYSTGVQAAETEKRKIFKQATDALLKRQQQLEQPDWFGIAAALGEPTRTGSWGERLSGVNKVLSASNKERRVSNQQLEDLQMKYKLANAESKANIAEKELSFGIQMQKAMPKAKQFEFQSLQEQLRGMDVNDPMRSGLEARIARLNYVPPAKSEGAETAEQYALKILKAEDAAPGTYTPEVVARARGILKLEKPSENLTIEQWANKILGDEAKKPGTHPKADVIRAQAIIKKSTYIKPEKDESAADKTPKAQSPAGKLAADRGFTPGTPEFAAEVKKIQQSGRHLSSTQEKELFEQEDIINGSQSALLNLEKALKLSPKAYEGGTANLRRAAGTVIPGISRSEAQVASTEFNSIMGEQMLSQLKAIFGGNPTEGERKVLADLQGSLTMSHEERAPIIKNAMAAVIRRYKAAEARMKGIKGGAYGPDAPEEYAKGGPVKMQQGGRYTDTSGNMSLANIGRAVGQGLGMSFGDEAIARVRAKMEGRPYDDIVAEERAAYEAFAKRNPITALSTEIASGILPTAAMMMVPGGQVGAYSNVVRAAPTMRKLATSGALTGGFSGLGSGEGSFVERLPSAGMGAGFGAVAGPVLSKGADLVGKGIRVVKDKLNPTIDSVSQAAMRKVLQAMGRDDMDVNAARQRMTRDQQLGVKSTLADTSPSTASLAEAVVTVPGKGKKQLGQKLENRLEEGRESVAQRTQRDVGKGVDYTAKEDQLVTTLRRNAKSVYDQAYAHGAVDDPRIATVLEDNTFKRAYEQARNIIEKEARAAELRGEDASKFKLQQIYTQDADGNMVRTGEVPDVRTLDYLKRGIDALIEQGYGANKSISKAEAGALKDLKNAFVDVIDEVAPAYKVARAQYKGDAEILDALRYGREDFLSPKNTPAQVIKELGTMSAGEKDALRAGAAQSILSKIIETPNQVNAAQRVIGAPSTRKRLAALFDNPTDYKLFEEALMRESELFRNAQNILRGSRTEMKKQAIEDLKKAPGILDVAGEAVDFAAAGPGSMVGRVLKLIQSRATVDEKTANSIANILKSGTPQEINAALDQLEKSAGKFAAEANRSNAVQKSVTRGVGSASGEIPRAPEQPAPEETEEQTLQRLLQGE